MALIEMKCAESVAVVISVTAVPCVRKQSILVFVITNPVSATLGPGKVLGFSAQAASVFFLLLPRFPFFHGSSVLSHEGSVVVGRASSLESDKQVDSMKNHL